MPLPSKEEVDADVMSWWDLLQSRAEVQVKREEIQVTVNEYKLAENTPLVPAKIIEG